MEENKEMGNFNIHQKNSISENGLMENNKVQELYIQNKDKF